MIKVKNLNKYFYRHKSNEIHVLNDISLEFPETGLVTIFGESGCGKTTFMNVLGGLDNFSSGNIQIDDLSIKKYSSKKIDRIRNEKIGYIFQNYLLLQQRTVYDNLILLLNMYDISLEEKNERIDYVLEAVGMLKYKKKNVSELSGGQQQRVAIARALIKSPSLILADEPTGNLDEKNTIQIMNIIKKISKNTLVILVSHEKSIATSYSDYIIEITDGKITNNNVVESNTLYQYEDDQNIYLKEFNYQNLSNDNINIDFYSNEDKKINVQIVYKNGKFYIKSDNDTIYLDNSSEIKLINDHKKVLDATTETIENNFELKPLEFVKTPRLSFKEQIQLTFSNLQKLKKRTRILSFPLFILIVLALLSLQSVASARFIDKQELLKMDSHVYTINLECGHKEMMTPVHQFGFKYFYNDFLEENPNIEPLLITPMKFYYSLPNFNQITEKKYEISNFTVLPFEFIDEKTLLYGRMPEKINEIVVEKWVLESAITESAVSNFLDITSFINRPVGFKNQDASYKIVGVVDSKQNTVYMNKWAIINIFPSTMKAEYIKIIGKSEFEKLNNVKLPELAMNTAIQNIDYNYKYGSKNLILNDDFSLQYSIIDYIDFNSAPYHFILNDNTYSNILKSIASCSFEFLNVYCKNDNEKKQVDEYIESVNEFYSSGQLIANKENGFEYYTNFDKVHINLNSYSDYDNALEPYLLESNKNVASRLLITLTILVISVIIVFFSMKSYSIKNIYDIGVYRAIGIKKSSIAFVYALEILIISLKTTLVGGIFTFLIVNIINGIPIFDLQIGMSFELFICTTLGLILLNIFVGVLPVIGYLRLTPSQILTKYDI